MYGVTGWVVGVWIVFGLAVLVSLGYLALSGSREEAARQKAAARKRQASKEKRSASAKAAAAKKKMGLHPSYNKGAPNMGQTDMTKLQVPKTGPQGHDNEAPRAQNVGNSEQLQNASLQQTKAGV